MKKKICCPYFELNDLERAYHDKEWGTPCRNDRKLFEYLMHEVLQCGLSWDAIIHDAKRFIALRSKNTSTAGARAASSPRQKNALRAVTFPRAACNQVRKRSFTVT